MLKRALLIGIDHYAAFSSLSGCVNDVRALRPLVTRNEDGSPNFHCKALIGAETPVTRDVVVAAYRALLAPGADVALLYFAGHGLSQPGDVTLACADGSNNNPGTRLSEIMGAVQHSSVGEVVVVLDCCFSGAAGTVAQLGGEVAALRPGVSILTASRSEQAAAEIPPGRGVFSTYLCGGLDGGAADVLGKVTIAGLYAYLSESFGAWQQRPCFKTNIDRANPLRTCEPAVPLAELRSLPALFPEADDDLPLDPSYEPDAEPRNADHERIFAILQRCRAAKLLEPVGTAHLYFAAMQNRACRLTALGRHYWEMARRGLL